MLIKSDKIFKENLGELLENGSKDENPRPKYETDGVPAHSIYINQVFEKYDLSKNEFPFSLARPIAVKTGIKEILAIYQGQENTRESFERYGVSWWKNWFNEMDNLGTAYPYNLESHRTNESIRTKVRVEPRIVDTKYAEFSWDTYKTQNLDSYKDLTYYTQEELDILYDIWIEKINMTIGFDGKSFIHKDWHSFKQFLLDLPYLPQFHLAREDKFVDWELSPLYYKSNAFSKDTCVFLSKSDIEEYMSMDNEDPNNTLRYELSRNQVNELIRSLKEDKYSRRHITSFWNWQTSPRKSLQECAYETIWSCRNVKGETYLDMTLIQRSSDTLVAGHINKLQYCALMLMIASTCGYKVGKFVHFIQNFHVYDRHMEQLEIILARLDELDKKECVQPILALKNKKDFYNITIDDFEVLYYDPIKEQLTFELAV